MPHTEPSTDGEDTSIDQEESALTEDDVRAVVRLIGDVAIMEGDHNAKRRRVMQGIADLIDADIWIWSLFRRCEPDGRVMTINWMHGGMSEAEAAQIAMASTNPDLPPPENHRLEFMEKSLTQTTRRRSQVVPDDVWYHDPHTKTYRQGFVDDFIYSFALIDESERIVGGVGLHRRWGRDAFTPRQARIAHIVLSEVRWLQEQALPQTKGEGTQHLPPRLRPIMAMLMDGRTRKEIAYHSGLSVHTVGGYIKNLYKHYGVSGRVELIRHFMAGDGGDTGGAKE